MLILVAVKSKGIGLQPLYSGIAGSNAAEGMDVCLL
jgi:hypothetical protein